MAKRQNAQAPPVDFAERVTFAVVGVVFLVMPAGAFAFSFGNVGLLGVHHEIDPRIAYFVGPIIDLSTVGALVAASYLSSRGASFKDVWPVHVMSMLCGLVMLALNCGDALSNGQYVAAGIDGVAPSLLIGWGLLGPYLIKRMTDAKRKLAPGTSDRHNAAELPARPRQQHPVIAAPQLPPPPGTTAPEVPVQAPATAVGDVSVPQPGNGVVVSIDGRARVRIDEWMTAAVPAYTEWISRHGEAPTANQLARMIHADNLSDTRQRQIRRETEKTIRSTGDLDDQEPERVFAGSLA